MSSKPASDTTERKFSFTKLGLERIEPTQKRECYRDTKTPGLVLTVYPSGVKTFIVYRRIGGRPERIRIGTFPQVTVEQARTKAAEINGAIIKDENPAAVKRALRQEPTFGEVFVEFLKTKRTRDGRPLSAKTTYEYQKCAASHLRRIMGEQLPSITFERLREVHRRIESPAQANKARAIVSSVFNFARRERITTLPNPAELLRDYGIKSRDRFLQPDELPRFFAAVADSPLRDFFLLAILTGARRSNLQEMAWADINLTESTWRIPMTKNGSAQTVPLPPEAVEILRERQENAVFGAKYVFPGPGKSGHLTEPKKAFAAILKQAGIENLRLHDLRRTLGSWQARQGASLAIIGKSLGHKSQQATAIYARLDLDPVRQSVNAATSAMLEAGGMKDGGAVIQFRRKRA